MQRHPIRWAVLPKYQLVAWFAGLRVGRMKVGVAGVGKWGVNLVRTLDDLGVETETFDPNQPSTISSYSELLGSVDKVMIASPPEHHFRMVLAAVRKKIPVFVEKPFVLTHRDALWIAEQTFSQIHVGHVLLHAEGFQKAKTDDPKRYEAWRAGNNPGYHDVSAWWDLAVHDVAACVDLFGKPTNITSVQTFETYEAWLEWPTKTARLQGSRIHDSKEWKISFDGKAYDPYSEKTEPLLLEVEAFLDGYDNLQHALNVVQTLERA